MKLSKNRIKNILKHKNKNQSRKKIHKHKKYFKHSRLSFKNRKKNLRISTIKQYKNKKYIPKNKKRKVYIGGSRNSKIFSIILKNHENNEIIKLLEDSIYHKFLIKDSLKYNITFHYESQDIIDKFLSNISEENKEKFNKIKQKQNKIELEKQRQKKEDEYYNKESDVIIKIGDDLIISSKADDDFNEHIKSMFFNL